MCGYAFVRSFPLACLFVVVVVVVEVIVAVVVVVVVVMVVVVVIVVLVYHFVDVLVIVVVATVAFVESEGMRPLASQYAPRVVSLCFSRCRQSTEV